MDIKSKKPTFEDIATFVREWAMIPAKQGLIPDTQLERDLGITGDDGTELLEAAEKRFNINFGSEDTSFRETFGLRPNEYLFNAEGLSFGMGKSDMITLFSNPNPEIHQFTLGELAEAIRKSPDRV